MSRKGRGGKRKTSLPAFGFAEDLLKGGSGKSQDEAAESSATAESASGSEESGGSRAEERPAPKRISLPAFGFAEDLLGPRAADESPAEPPPRASSATPRTANAEPSPASRTLARDENRIFAFADSLEAEVEEEKRKPVKLETWVTFTLASETFALPVNPVREILRISAITRVPHAPHPIRGVTNLRGRVIPVIDLRLRIELPEGPLTKASRIIVVGSRSRLLGLLVDGVHQVVHLDVDHMQPPPEDVMTIQSDYISGVYQTDDQLLLLLDVDRALVIRETALAGGTMRHDADDSLAGAAEA